MMGENEDNFYVTLFSNSSMKAYPNNSISAFRVQPAHEIVLSRKVAWEVALCEFSCPPPKTDTIAAHVVIGTTKAKVYFNLICPQFVGSKKVRCLRTFINPRSTVILSLKTRITYRSSSGRFETSLYLSWTPS